MGAVGLVITALAACVAALTADVADGRVLVPLGFLGVATAWLAMRRRDRERGIPGDSLAATLVVVAVASTVFTCVGLRARGDLEGLSRPLPDRLEGIGELGSDPQRSRFGTDFELVLEGRRWRASARREVEGAISALRTGDRIAVEATVADLHDAPSGWVRSRHLAGRLSVSSAQPAGGTKPWFRAANWVHERLERGAASMDGAQRSLYLGLVVGDDRDQPELTRFHFRASGLTHLLAVSGQNLVFVLAVLAPLRERIGHRARWILGAGAVLGFVIVTRAEPSVLRAATMAILALSATVAGRRASGFRLVCLSVPILLICDPMLVHSVGFRLSVAATSGLVLLARPIENRLIGPRIIRLPLAVTLAAQAGAVPVMAYTFGGVSVVAVPANLLAEPAAAVVMTLGLTSGLLSGVLREEIAWVLQLPVRAAVWWVDRVAQCAGGLSLPPSGVIAWAVLAAGVMCSMHLWRTAGTKAIGRVLLLAAFPMVLLLRPPLAESRQRAALVGGSELRSVCGRWELHLGEAGIEERIGIEVVESLWRLGLTRVHAVVLNAGDGVTQKRSVGGPGWSGAPDLAEVLHAPLVRSGPATSCEVPEHALGIGERAPPRADAVPRRATDA